MQAGTTGASSWAPPTTRRLTEQGQSRPASGHPRDRVAVDGDGRSILPLTAVTDRLALGVAYDSHGSDYAAPLLSRLLISRSWSVDITPSRRATRSASASRRSPWRRRSARTAPVCTSTKPASAAPTASIVTSSADMESSVAAATSTVDDVSYHISTLVSASRATIVSIVLGIPGLRSTGTQDSTIHLRSPGQRAAVNNHPQSRWLSRRSTG